MAYRRRRRTVARRRPYRRYRRRRTPMYKTPRQKVYYFKRTCKLGEIVVPDPNTLGIEDRLVFSLNDLPQSGDFTALYDMYRINAVKVSFIPVSNVTFRNSASNTPVNDYSNRLYTAWDYNDAPVPFDADTVRAYNNCKWTPYNKIHKRYSTVYPPPNATSITNMGNRRSLWLNSNTTSINYFGMVYAMEPILPVLPVGTKLYEIEATYYVVCRSPK